MTQKVRTSTIPFKQLVLKTGQVSDIKDPPVVYSFTGRNFKDSGPNRGIYS